MNLEAYVSQMWDALHLTPEQRASDTLRHVQEFVTREAVPVEVEINPEADHAA